MVIQTEGSITKRFTIAGGSPFACWYNPHFLHTIEQLQRISPVVPLQVTRPSLSLVTDESLLIHDDGMDDS
jgi:hypothetical protein